MRQNAVLCGNGLRICGVKQPAKHVNVSWGSNLLWRNASLRLVFGKALHSLGSGEIQDSDLFLSLKRLYTLLSQFLVLIQLKVRTQDGFCQHYGVKNTETSNFSHSNSLILSKTIKILKPLKNNNLLKTMWEMKKMLVTSIFSYLLNLMFSILLQKNLTICSILKLSFAIYAFN